MNDPRTLIQRLEAAPTIPAGTDERFNGYGVMGLPFRSGHVLAMRRFVASSVGQPYTSVWHRDPSGDWVFYSDAPAQQSCTRYFGADAADAIETRISVEWIAPFQLRIGIPSAELEWRLEAAPSTATRLMNASGRLLPDAAWRNPGVLSAMGSMAGPLLRVGHVGLQGSVPNGQRFVANPRVLWAIVDSRASLAGTDFGAPGPVRPQARLGDFWIPQRGILAMGQSYFDAFDAARHLPHTTRPRR